MKMKQLLILVGAVVVLWAIFVLLDRTSVPTAEDEYLVQADSAAIQELEIMNQQKGETITLTRRDDGWYITNPIDYPAMSSISPSCSIRSVRCVSNRK